MPLGLGLPRRLEGSGVASDETQALLARVETVPAKAAPDAVVADDETTPALTAQLRGDAGWAEARMAEGEGDDTALDERGELVRHAWLPPLPRTQDLEPVALDAPLPDVVGRTVDTEACGTPPRRRRGRRGRRAAAGSRRGRHPRTCGSLLSSDVVVEGEGERINGRHPATKGRVPSSQASVEGPPVGTTR